MIIQST